MVFVLSGGVRGENSNKHAMFVKPRRLQNEVEMVQKRPERRKKSRARTEKREKYADDRPGSVRERSRADRRPLGGEGRKSADPKKHICEVGNR